MKNNGFTLAEVLITLTIIGVIAVITIPTLMKKWQDHADVIRVKEAYSIFSNAMRLAISENGLISKDKLPGGAGVDPTDSGNRNYLINLITPYLNVVEDTGDKDIDYGYNSKGQYCTNCKYPLYAKQLNNKPTTTAEYYWLFRRRVTLKNGMIFNINNRSIWQVNTVGYVAVDINGKQGPARLGYDIFIFPFTENGFEWKAIKHVYNGDIGYLTGSSTVPYLHPDMCNINKSVDGLRQGQNSCADWVLRKNNMDYKYRDVSSEWNWHLQR